MKIKSDFVTNSSSIGYIIVGDDKLLMNLKEIFFDNGLKKKDLHQYKYFDAEKGITPLDTYNRGRKKDWIDKITGRAPEFGKVGSIDMFNAAKEHLSEGQSIVIMAFERDSNHFETIINKDIKIIWSED